MDVMQDMSAVIGQEASERDTAEADRQLREVFAELGRWAHIPSACDVEPVGVFVEVN